MADETARRLDQMEAEVVRLRRTRNGLIASVAILAVLTVGSHFIRPAASPAIPQSRQPPEVEASRFVLRDFSGTVKAVLETNKIGQPQLLLGGSHGKTRIRLGIEGGDADF